MHTKHDRTSNAQFNVVSNTEVTGQVTDGHFCGASNTYTVYFDMQFNTPFTNNGTFSGGDYLTFDASSNQTVLAKVGVSYVSSANAAGNLSAENSGWDFRPRARLGGTDRRHWAQSASRSDGCSWSTHILTRGTAPVSEE